MCVWHICVSLFQAVLQASLFFSTGDTICQLKKYICRMSEKKLTARLSVHGYQQAGFICVSERVCVIS